MHTNREQRTGCKDKYNIVAAPKKSIVWGGEEKVNRNLSVHQNLPSSYTLTLSTGYLLQMQSDTVLG